MVATQTANGQYKYNQVFFGQTLEQLVQELQLHQAKTYGWAPNPLKKGGFGFDNLAICIGLLMDKIQADKKLLDDEERASEVIHEGWIINYVYWRDSKPELKSKDYKAPAKPLGDERRNMCAVTRFEDLPEDEKNKDKVIANFIVNKCMDWFDTQDLQMKLAGNPEDQKMDWSEDQTQVSATEEEQEQVQVVKMECQAQEQAEPISEERNFDHLVYSQGMLEQVSRFLQELKDKKYLPLEKLHELATEHFKKDFKYIRAAKVETEVSLKQEEIRAISPIRKVSSGKTSSDGSGCTYKFTSRHKTRAGEICGAKCIMGSNLCREHTKPPVSTLKQTKLA